VGFFSVFCLFVWHIIMGFFIFIFIPIFFFLSVLSLHHHYLLTPSLSLLLLCYNPLFSFPTTLSAPFHPISPPAFNYLFPNLSPHYPSLLHTHHLLTNLLYQLYTTPTPAIPDTSTLHYNRNTLTQGSQNPAAPTLLPSLTHPTAHLPF
jgi:hypothetical protein